MSHSRLARAAVGTVLLATLLLAPARLLGADPGIAYPSASEAGDDKLGSVLIFNVISSNTPSASRNTELSITNHHGTQSAALRLFFVDGSTGVVHRTRLIVLEPNQILSMPASMIAPTLEGYAIAVAFDRISGCPISFNHLSGRAAIKLPSGHHADLAAEAVAAVYAGTIDDCTSLSTTATLSFDGVQYNRLAATVAIDNYASAADGNSGLLVLNRIGGDLTANAATLGIAYEAWGSSGSAGNGTINSGSSQLRMSPADLLPLQSGDSAWVQFDASGGSAGAFLNFNPNAQVAPGAFNGGRNLHRLALATDSLVVPVVADTPGFPYPAASAASDNRAGSVLVFPFFTTSVAMPNSESATLALTNTHDTTVDVKLFFVRGNTGAVNPLATMLLTLPPHGLRSVPASAVAPGFRGYIIAVAIEVSTGCPIAFNHLIGDVDVKLGTGHFASLPATAVAALYTGTVSGCAAGDASLNFDGVDYNLLPRGLALDNTGSSADGNFTLFVLDHIGGDLEAALTPLGTVDGSIYDSDSNPTTAFDFNAAPQFLGTFDPGVPAGISAWLEAYPALEAAMVGSVMKFNANATSAASAFTGGHNLHVLTLAPDILALAGPPVNTPTVTPTPRPSATRTSTRTTTRTPTRTPTPTLAPTVIPTATPLKTPTRTGTPTNPAPTSTRTRTPTIPAPTSTRTRTPTNPAPTSTRTRTPTGLLPTATRTRSGTATATAIPTATATLGASATATATNAAPNATSTSTPTRPTPTRSVSPSPNPMPPCVGDCNRNGRVTVNEAIVGVNILLDSLPFSACPAFDRDDTGTVTIDEVIQGVDNLLGACPM